MRISCVSFARIQDQDRRFALLVNAGRLKYKGQRILSPIGGGLETRPADQRWLQRNFGANSFEGTTSLQFQVPDRQVPSVNGWFRQRVRRELSVLREVREELGTEAQLLTPHQLRDARETLVGFTTHRADTTRKVATGPLTTYLIEVYDVALNPDALQTLIAAAQNPNGWIHFATAAEIQAGKTATGIKIGDIVPSIVHPHL
jgi:hypothetical protein